MQRGIALVVLSVSLFPAGRPAAAAEHELRISVPAPERSIWGKTLKALADELEKETEGRVDLKVYWSGVQGDDRTVLRKLRIGRLDGAVLFGQGVADVCPGSLVLNLPLLFRDEEEARLVLDELRPIFERQCREKGYEALSWPLLGFSYLFSKDEVRTIEALRRSKPWLIENDPLGRHFYDALDITPVSTGMSNVLAGLQSGLIRTVFSPPVGLIALQWHGRVRYRLDLKITFSFGIFVMSANRWKRIPEELQRTIRDLSEKRTRELNRKIRGQNLEALRILQEKEGIKTIQPEPEDRAEFIRTTERLAEKTVGTYFSRETLDRVQSVLEEHRRGKAK